MSFYLFSPGLLNGRIDMWLVGMNERCLDGGEGILVALEMISTLFRFLLFFSLRSSTSAAHPSLLYLLPSVS